MGAAIRFDGEVAVVTGAGAGLGREYALRLGERGAAVVCNDLVPEAAAATAAAVVALGGRAVAEGSSVATPEGGAAVVGAALDEFGSLDAVVNNAGQLRNAAFEDMSSDDFGDVVRTHLCGTFHVTQPAFRHMRAAGRGRIVVTSSGAVFGSPWQANYAAAEAGFVGLCRTVALEGADHGITANAVLPMALTGIGADGPPPYPPELLDETVRTLRPLVPLMTTANVAPLVLYLASRDCAVTGRAFSVGCGHVAEVRLGVAAGWYADDPATSSPEEVAAHLSEVLDATDLDVPSSMLDEVRAIVERRPSADGDRPTGR